jgi:pimeloyl-ACP methyl ester carboxylesterase
LFFALDVGDQASIEYLVDWFNIPRDVLRNPDMQVELLPAPGKRPMRYRFSTFELDTERHEFHADGGLVSLEPQVFDVLRHLVENHDRMVGRDELIDVVWGGRIVSDATISARINAVRRALGDSGKTQDFVKTIPRRGFRFVASVEVDGASVPGGEAAPEVAQKIRFCRSADGTRIAYATTGSGPPLVRVGHWMSHVELDWHNPITRRRFNELGKSFALTRYDQRSQGLSDWSVDDFSLDAFVDDVEAVVNGVGLDDFALYGLSQGAPIGVAFAARHPDRVRGLILHGGYVRGRMRREAAGEREQGEALLTLMRHGWGKEGSPFIKAFTSMYMPTATDAQVQSWVELQKQTASAENAVKLRQAVDNFDVTDLLEKVTAPTLVIHARNDGVHPLDQGRKLAAGIANSEFVLLESQNHVILPEEPAWPELIESIRAFVLANT